MSLKLTAFLSSCNSLRRIIAVCLVLSGWGCSQRVPEGSHRKTTETHIESFAQAPSVRAANPGYVGIDRCKPCHTDRVAEFRETRHFLAAVDATQSKLAAGFQPGNNRYHSSLLNLTFEMTVEDERPWMTVWNESASDRSRRKTPIDMIYGYGADTDETYFSWQNDRVQELPVAWLHSDNCWGGVVMNPHGTGDYSRPVTVQCLNCHFTWVDCIPGDTTSFVRETALWGVTCERCHGPGQEHVAYHEQHPEERTAQAIVHPGQLPRERVLDLCAQCHDNAIQLRRAAFTYRPGDLLADFVRTPHFAHEEDNHVANQHAGMTASQCFQESDTMTCVTCHDPHHRRSPENAGARSCQTCHQADSCSERERLPLAVRSDCIGCHMPVRNKVQVNFRTDKDGYVPPARRWEHRIAVYPEARDRVMLAWLQKQTDSASRAQAADLAQSLAEHWTHRGEGYEKETRFLMAIDAFRQADGVQPSEMAKAEIGRLVATQTQIDTAWFRIMHLIDQQQYAEAIGELHTLLELQPRMARARGRLGTLYAATGDKPQGRKHLQVATELDPHDSYSYGMLGWLDYLDGRYEEAHRWLQLAVERDARGFKVNYQLGLTLVALERYDEARKVFEYVLELNPSSIDACQALISLEQTTRNHDAAVTWARRAVRIAREGDANLWLTLSECCQRAGQIPQAKQAAERALALAEQQQNATAIRRAKGRLQAIPSR